MLSVERIDAGRFASMGEEWNALLADSDADSVFLTWEWLHTWWRHLGGRHRLRILAVRDGGELVAVAPLARAPLQLDRFLPFPSLRWLGTGAVGSDYLDLVIRRGWEDAAVAVLADHVRAEGAMLELRQLGSGAQAWRLAERLAPAGWTARPAATEVCPFIRLEGRTWEAYLASLGSAHRANVQRRLRSLGREFGVELVRVRTEEERAAALDRLIALHQARWRGRGRSEAFASRGLVAFHHELTRRALAAGWLRLLELRLDGVAAAALYGFRYKKAFSFYQSGLDPRFARQSVGLVTMGLAIRSAIEEGAHEYDLLHGAEGYKFLWARETRPLGRLELFPPRWRGYLCERSLSLGRAARHTARRVLGGAA
ncbi:MAG TPA: GNAT family N-acetyltransferase [Myxococcaceae bacterium]|nr:GNAT family N-acetyltransferase [Myxococcaceae bacterium]